MSELFRSVMADNGAYLLSAYGIIIGAIIGYALWMHARLGTARARREKGHLDPSGTR